MPSERSNLSGGGHRVTERVNKSDIFGNPKPEVRTTDFDAVGNRVSGIKSDSNGDQWNVNSAGCTTHKIGSDGRNK